MYTQNDFQKVKSSTRTRLILFGVLALAFIVLMFVFNSLRLQVLSCASAGLGFIACYFVWSFKISPWVKYNRHMKDISEGQKRVTECEFVSFTPETRIHDGVEVHDFVVTVGKTEEDERLFYWDADKPAPVLEPGCKLTVTSYGNFVIDLKSA